MSPASVDAAERLPPQDGYRGGTVRHPESEATMTTMRQLRMIAHELPETEEDSRAGRPSFSVRGKRFVSVDKDGHVLLPLADGDVDEAVAAHPRADPISRNGTVTGIAIPLAEVNGKDLRELVRKAWSVRAPKRLAASFAESERGEGGDLPATIGRPATRALHGAGLTTLDLVATRSETELLALHGVGPKAIRILTAELAGSGRTLRGDR